MTVKEIGKFWFVLITALVTIIGCSSQDETKEAGGSTGEVTSGGEITVGYYSDASNYDPLIASSGGDETLLYLIYDRLIDFDENFEPLPALAESWENVDDTTWTLNLRENVKFHDGTKFDAEVAKFNIERANSDDSNKADLQSIESVEVVDEYTIQLNLNEPNSGLLQAFMTAAGMMVSPTALEEHGEDYTMNPVGTGPYLIESRVPDNEIVFVKNEDYWREDEPKIDKITLRVLEESTRINALKSGEVDIIAPVSSVNKEDLENSPDIVVNSEPSLNFQYIFINTGIEPMNDKNIRKAIQYGINREDLVEAIQFGDGEAAQGIFPTEHPGAYENSQLTYDPDKAKEYIEKSNIENPTLDMLVKPDAFDQRIAEFIQSQLKEIGITVNIEPTEVTKLVDLAFGEAKYPATLARASGRPDPNALLDLYYSENSYYNPGKYKNDELAELIKDAAKETDSEKRMEIIQAANQLVMEEEAMGIPLFFEPMIVAHNEKVAPFDIHQYGKFMIHNLSLQK